MITINEETLKELILKTEPDFIAQVDLQNSGYGKVNKLTEMETVWIWSKESVRKASDLELNYIIALVIA